ncbi:hypothetical protein [Bradyrhizobium yuanmingense]|uniref:hypothetical protein n=1 Tax=Bradyrhizobium yuanmingense TaxID=108015 RepID=UPI000A4034E2|nr:hypothetical protein [Bradyrhizobium yuanmingense]
MKRIASRGPNLDIFRQKLIDREVGYWTITEDGRNFLDALEKLDRCVTQSHPEAQAEKPFGDEGPPIAGCSATTNRPQEPSSAKTNCGRVRALSVRYTYCADVLIRQAPLR